MNRFKEMSIEERYIIRNALISLLNKTNDYINFYKKHLDDEFCVKALENSLSDSILIKNMIDEIF